MEARGPEASPNRAKAATPAPNLLVLPPSTSLPLSASLSISTSLLY